MRNLELAWRLGNSQHSQTVSSHFDDHEVTLDRDHGSCSGIGYEESQTRGVGEGGHDDHLGHGVGSVVGLVGTFASVAMSGCCSCIGTDLGLPDRTEDDDHVGNGGIALDRSDGLVEVDTKTGVWVGESPRHVLPNAAGLVPWHDDVVLDLDSFREAWRLGGVHKTPTTPWACPLEIWPDNLPQ